MRLLDHGIKGELIGSLLASQHTMENYAEIPKAKISVSLIHIKNPKEVFMICY